MSDGTVVILLGPPGSGKGTQAARLCADLGIPHVATGDLFRRNLSEGTELGEKVRSYMESGQLVPDDLVTEMLFDRVARPDCAKGYLLDGFPRTLPQARALEKGIDGRLDWEAFLLDVPDEVLIERAVGRLICKSCGKIHHVKFTAPRVEGVCNACGQAALYRRDDDAPEVVRERLAVYREQTKPLISFYRDRERLAVIDGNRPMDEVHADLTTRSGRAAG